MTSTFDLTGTSVLVTGGAAGIGRAIVSTAAALGARVGVIDLEPVGEADASACADVSDPDAVRSAVADVASALGGLTGLVNNAGIAPGGRFRDLTPDAWSRTVAVNLDGTFHCTRAALPHLVSSERGSIVNIGSIAGRSYSRTASVAYATTKGGVIAFTRQLAAELASEDVRVNCVCPGLVDTEIMARNTSTQALRRLVDTVPMGRLGSPEEIAGTVCFLLCEAASYVTGAVLDVTGGLQ